MALNDKDIIITPNRGQSADPRIVFSGASSVLGPQNITLQVYPTENGTLSFEGSAGQLFSITNSLTGTIFSVNDVSGIPSIEVLDTGIIRLAQFGGRILVGTAIDNGTDRIQVSGDVTATTFKGPLSGNATTATTLQNTRTIWGQNFNGGANVTGALTGVTTVNMNNQLTNTLATGTAPFAITSTTRVANLNVATAGTADTLTTTRTIWGQNFNGSANVTGALTGVTTVSMNNQLTNTLATGTAPFAITSTTRVANLNVATAGTADTLTTARTIAMSGAATGTATSFNGSTNITIPVTGLNATNLDAGTVPDARLTGTYTNFTHRLDGSNTVFTLPSPGSTTTVARTIYGLAEYKSAAAAQIGAIVIIAPNTNSTIMHQLEVQGMLYNQNIFRMTVQGYRTTGAWSDVRKISFGTVDIQTRWAVTPDGKNCLILGDVGTSWSYPHISVVRAMFSHTGTTDAYCSGWTVAIVTDLSTYTQVTATIADSVLVGSVSGNAATATALQTTRAINGTNFNGTAAITTANWGTARTITIGSTGKSVNGSANVAWTLAEIGAMPTAAAAINTVDVRAPIFYNNTNTGFYWQPSASAAHRLQTPSGFLDLGPMNTGYCHFQTDRAQFYFNKNIDVDGQVRIYADTANRFTQGNLYLRSTSPTVYFRDTDHNVAMLHCNSNLLYVLRGATDSETWTTVNGQWPVYWNLTNNEQRSGGAIFAVGDVTAFSSDRRLKENIRPIENSLEKVLKLTGVNYDWKDIVDELGFNPGIRKNDAGLIAQDVEAVMPQAVAPAPFDQEWDNDSKVSKSKSGENYLTVKYEKLVPLLVEAIKDLASQLEELKNSVKKGNS